MWLKSNSVEEAARIQIPNTRFLFMSVRPDLLLIRVLSKNLIMWDSVEPSEEWLMNQLPAILRLLPSRYAPILFPLLLSPPQCDACDV
jgi:anaphase-promoting complex subunit 1